MNVVELPAKKPTIKDLQADLNALFFEKYGHLEVAESIGVLEIFKWEFVSLIPEQDE